MRTKTKARKVMKTASKNIPTKNRAPAPRYHPFIAFSGTLALASFKTSIFASSSDFFQDASFDAMTKIRAIPDNNDKQQRPVNPSS